MTWPLLSGFLPNNLLTEATSTVIITALRAAEMGVRHGSELMPGDVYDIIVEAVSAVSYLSPAILSPFILSSEFILSSWICAMEIVVTLIAIPIIMPKATNRIAIRFVLFVSPFCFLELGS